MQRIFLTGYMGAGKTTLGKALAERMGLAFTDLDAFIENRYHQTVRRIFASFGETVFREMERKALHEISEFEDIVISTGGGTPCFFDNMQLMNERGITVYLKVSIEELARRVAANTYKRPALQGFTGDELRLHISNMLAKRRPDYEKSRIIFEAERLFTQADVDNVCNRLILKINELTKQ